MKYLFYISIFLITFAPIFVFAESTDSDNDGLSDEEEALYYTDPQNPDTDEDSFLDGLEVEKGYSPHKGDETRIYQYDYDGDGLNDWTEGWFHGDRGKADTDGDGVNDFDEVALGQGVNDPTNKIKFRRWIEVDLTKQRLYYFVDRVKIFNFPVSTGKPSTPTPPGDYKILNKIESKRYTGAAYDLPNVKWNMMFDKRGYYIHGSYWHNNYGIRTASHGCVNMRTEDAGVLYKYIDLDVPVKVTGKTPKGKVVGL